jgi:WD40 repeat protein
VLLTGSNDSSLRVWQISQQKCVRLLKGHKGTITSTIPIKDGVTLLSSAEDGNIMIWNMSSGKLFNKLNQHTKVINAMHLFKDGTKFVSVSDDKTICIWKVIYGYSNEFLRRTFSSCEPEKVYEDCCEVTSVNSSADDFNLLITGGTDQKIKIWNTEENMCIKQVNCHTFGLSSILFFENPFKLATYERYIILTSGFGENSIKLSRSKSDYSENLILNAYADTQKDIPANFRVQLVKSKVTESLKLVTLSQTYGQGISIWALE